MLASGFKRILRASHFVALPNVRLYSGRGPPETMSTFRPTRWTTGAGHLCEPLALCRQEKSGLPRSELHRRERANMIDTEIGHQKAQGKHFADS